MGELINLDILFQFLTTAADNHQYKNAEFIQKRLWILLEKRYKINCNLIILFLIKIIVK